MLQRVPGVCFAVAVYRKLLGIKEKRVPVETTAGGGKRGRGGGLSESKIKEWKKNLAQYDVSVNTVSVPRREDR